MHTSMCSHFGLGFGKWSFLRPWFGRARLALWIRSLMLVHGFRFCGDAKLRGADGGLEARLGAVAPFMAEEQAAALEYRVARVSGSARHHRNLACHDFSWAMSS